MNGNVQKLTAEQILELAGIKPRDIGTEILEQGIRLKSSAWLARDRKGSIRATGWKPMEAAE